MIWVGVTVMGKTPSNFIYKNIKINAKICQDKVFKIILLQKQKNPNGIFQQDWAPAHEAKMTLTFFDVYMLGCLTKDKQPSNSLDLNLLNFSIWNCLEEKLNGKKYPIWILCDTNLSKLGMIYLHENYQCTFNSVIPRLKACKKVDILDKLFNYCYLIYFILLE